MSWEINLNNIKVEERARVEKGNVSELATSISRFGLFHPIIVRASEDSSEEKDYILVAGERRLEACKSLNWEAIPAKMKEDMTELEAKEVEVEENVRREDLDWQERVRAEKQYHEIKQKLHGESTAAPKKDGWGIRDTARSLGSSVGSVSEDLSLVKDLDKYPKAREARSRAAAKRIIREKKQAEVEAELAKRRAEKASSTSAPIESILEIGDAVEWTKELESESVDMLLTDPPFGKNLAMRSELGAVTPYKDDEDEVLEIIGEVIQECYRVLKEDRVALIFFDVSLYQELVDIIFEKTDFKVNLTPLIWAKEGAHGTLPNRTYYAQAYECILHLQKGSRPLRNPGDRNWLRFKRPKLSKKRHKTQKPLSLLKYLLSQHTFEGEKIIDPFAGSGSTIIAAYQMERIASGCELREDYGNKARLAISKVLSPEEEERDFKEMKPGSREWMDYWKKHPDEQEEMLEFQEEKEEE